MTSPANESAISASALEKKDAEHDAGKEQAEKGVKKRSAPLMRQRRPAAAQAAAARSRLGEIDYEMSEQEREAASLVVQEMISFQQERQRLEKERPALRDARAALAKDLEGWLRSVEADCVAFAHEGEQRYLVLERRVQSKQINDKLLDAAWRGLTASSLVAAAEAMRARVAELRAKPKKRAAAPRKLAEGAKPREPRVKLDDLLPARGAAPTLRQVAAYAAVQHTLEARKSIKEVVSVGARKTREHAKRLRTLRQQAAKAHTPAGRKTLPAALRAQVQEEVREKAEDEMPDLPVAVKAQAIKFLEISDQLSEMAHKIKVARLRMERKIGAAPPLPDDVKQVLDQMRASADDHHGADDEDGASDAGSEASAASSAPAGASSSAAAVAAACEKIASGTVAADGKDSSKNDTAKEAKAGAGKGGAQAAVAGWLQRVNLTGLKRDVDVGSALMSMRQVINKRVPQLRIGQYYGIVQHAVLGIADVPFEAARAEEAAAALNALLATVKHEANAIRQRDTTVDTRIALTKRPIVSDEDKASKAARRAPKRRKRDAAAAEAALDEDEGEAVQREEAALAEERRELEDEVASNTSSAPPSPHPAPAPSAPSA